MLLPVPRAVGSDRETGGVLYLRGSESRSGEKRQEAAMSNVMEVWYEQPLDLELGLGG